MTTIFTKSNGQTPSYPDDLRSAVGERRLIELALEAVQIVGEELPRQVRALQDQPSPKMMLTLLTYCYAAEIYGSEDIEWACRHDAAVRYVCGNDAPDQESLRRFRRANRPWIEACLIWVHSKSEAATSPATETEVLPRASLNPRADADLAVLVHRKLELAMLIDTAAND